MFHTLYRWLSRWGAFVPALIVLMSCPLSLFASLPLHEPDADMALLQVDIDYSGDWYIETFGYTRDAANIQHYLLILPEQEVATIEAGWVFTSILFPATPEEPVAIRDDRQEYAWALPYLYSAPGGYFSGEFAPGTYRIAAAFIAAPLSREEAGVDDSAILYAGITGGGASTEYREVQLTAGQTAKITVTLSDANGWACPWLYVYDGQHFERRTEILRNLNGPGRAQTEVSDLGPVAVVEGAVIVQVAEERDELTYLDEFSLLVDGVRVDAAGNSAVVQRIRAADSVYLVIAEGESHTLRFGLPASLAGRAQVEVQVVASGYYVPLD